MSKKIVHQSSIKKGMIDLLMFTLYPDARTIYREYVQNSLDAINLAVNQGILSKIKDGVVNIDIDSKQKSITIRDNGIGIDIDNAPSRILDISASTKDGISAAGQFGIGRLVGGGFCHKLIFKTSSKGENLATQVTFDVDKIWEMVKQSDLDYLASEVIDESTEIIHIDEKPDAHYFEVYLQDIKTKYASILLNKDSVIEYLNAVAPVDYKSEFKNGVVYKSTKEQPDFKDLQEELERVQVFVGTKKVEKQYGLQIEGSGDRIHKLEYFKIENEKFGLLAWGWFALTKYSIQIGRDDNLSCIRLRKHNIQIGNKDRLSSFTTPLWREMRGNSYFYGELFAIHPNLTPTADRNDLCPSEEKEELSEGLKEFFKKLSDVYTKANAAKKAIDKIREATKRIQSNKCIDRISRDDIDNKGKSVFERLERNASYKPLLDMLLLYKPAFIEAMTDANNAINLLQTQKTVIGEQKHEVVLPEKSSTDLVLTETPVFDNLCHDAPSANNQMDSSVGVTNFDEYLSHTPTSKDETQQVVTTLIIDNTLEPNSKPNTLLNKDILSRLNGIIGDDEIWILRRVFRVLNTYCPNNEHDKKLIELLEKEIVKEFDND